MSPEELKPISKTLSIWLRIISVWILASISVIPVYAAVKYRHGTDDLAAGVSWLVFAAFSGTCIWFMRNHLVDR